MKADPILIEQTKRGNKQAFSQLVERHQGTMMKVALRVTKDLNLAEDVVQESFIKAYQKLDSFEGRSTFRSWMYQITLNTARNKLRSLKRENVSIDKISIGFQQDFDGDIHRSTVYEMLKDEINSLPEKQKQAICLRVYDDMSFKEVAEIMACPYDTAKANYRHAMLKLKSKLKAHPEFQLMKDQVWSQINEPKFAHMEVD